MRQRRNEADLSHEPVQIYLKQPFSTVLVLIWSSLVGGLCGGCLVKEKEREGRGSFGPGPSSSMSLLAT